MLDHPKWVFFLGFSALTLVVLMGICDGVISGPNEGAFAQIQTGNVLQKAKAIFNILSFNYPWMTGFLEYVKWVPFRVINIMFLALLAWDARKMIPFLGN